MSSIHSYDGEPDIDDASFAAHRCNSSGSTPTNTSRSKPSTTPHSKPSTTPRSKPNTTTCSTLSNKTKTSQLASNTTEKFKTPVTNQFKSKSKSHSNIILTPSDKKKTIKVLYKNQESDPDRR
jgi:hypothetical protein